MGPKFIFMLNPHAITLMRTTTQINIIFKRDNAHFRGTFFVHIICSVRIATRFLQHKEPQRKTAPAIMPTLSASTFFSDLCGKHDFCTKKNLRGG